MTALALLFLIAMPALPGHFTSGDSAFQPDPDLGETTTTDGRLFAQDESRRQSDPLPISDIVRRIAQDRNGHFWFGTNGDGVYRYNGEALEHFTAEQGFVGRAVRAIKIDAEGQVWFGTERGLIRYDGKAFHWIGPEQGLPVHDIWCMTIARDGTFWIGGLQGVVRFDGKAFTPFELPEVEPDLSRGVHGSRLVQCILEDSHGRFWFATSGGAFCWDGESLSHFTERDGLCNNSVNEILEDRSGRFWFATHHEGVCRWDGSAFTHFTAEQGVEGSEAWDFLEDSQGNIWFTVENQGIYRFDGETFARFHTGQGVTSNAIQSAYEDQSGRIWLCGAGGVFRLDGKAFIPVTRNGPWNGP